MSVKLTVTDPEAAKNPKVIAWVAEVEKILDARMEKRWRELALYGHSIQYVPDNAVYGRDRVQP